ncbi:hypothetical protein J2D73_13310 [Acetobacter sacchari]|uniref:Phage tail protein n=1 Tax=Acetobacter sacchari TaxID=2661687 RepID=A0ABS3LXW6_9PROT|nr:hypothetical protein [Acetobacter sacchari]MBO1360765.1 hypothetical protein [Acetobacter sacchari]
MTSLLRTSSAIASLSSARAFSLGSFIFLDTEVPSFLPWGGIQSASVSWAPGGAKTISQEGYFDAPLEWSGLFRGSNAVTRAQALETMARVGNVLSFVGAALSRQVIITSFQAIYTENGNVVPYNIRCEVVPTRPNPLNGTKSALANLIGSDGATAVSTLSTAMSSLASYAAGITSAAGVYAGQITPLASLFGTGNSMTALYAQLTGAATVAGGLSSTSSTSSLNGAGEQLSALSSSLYSMMGLSGQELSSIAESSGPDVVGSMSALSAAVGHSGILASVASANAYVTRATANVNIATGASNLTIKS